MGQSSEMGLGLPAWGGSRYREVRIPYWLVNVNAELFNYEQRVDLPGMASQQLHLQTVFLVSALQLCQWFWPREAEFRMILR